MELPSNSLGAISLGTISLEVVYPLLDLGTRADSPMLLVITLLSSRVLVADLGTSDDSADDSPALLVTTLPSDFLDIGTMALLSSYAPIMSRVISS